MKTITTRTRAVKASPAALAALEAAETARQAIELERDRMGDRLSELAARRADAIRSALDEGMTQADVARVLGVTPQAVHNILRQH